MARKTTVTIPEIVAKLREKYPNLSPTKITQALVNKGADILSSADEETIKDALLNA